MDSPQTARNTQLKNDTFGIVSGLQERFRKLQEAIWLTAINKILNSHHVYAPFVKQTICLKSLRVTRVTQFKSEFDFFILAVVEDVQLLGVLTYLVKQGQ